MRRIVIFGANGLLGSRLCTHLNSSKFQVFTAGRSKILDYKIDVSNVLSLKQFCDDIQPDHVINLIAETNVDKCETDVAAASFANTLIPCAISKAVCMTKKKDIHVVQISTDQVYQGNGNHIEDDVAPLNVYGLSKLAGELMMDAGRTAILRTNFFGKGSSSGRLGFSDWIIDSIKHQTEITLFENVRFSALHIRSLCQIIDKVLDNKLIGTYNVGCHNGISKADFGLTIAEKLGFPIDLINVGELSSVPLKARRPLDMTLNVKRLESTLGIECPDIYEEIAKVIMEEKNV